MPSWASNSGPERRELAERGARRRGKPDESMPNGGLVAQIWSNSAVQSRTSRLRPTNVYFIQAGRNGQIKIGRADSPSKRITGLQTGSPEELRVLAVIPGPLWLERYFHRHWREYRSRGEWFSPEPDILNFLHWWNTGTGHRPVYAPDGGSVQHWLPSKREMELSALH